ncbi:radical SAM protein [Clostridiaceae bacterium M8S5]|nr:radical SAM protein [Clostridiaceae bacterium M8S5]
MNCKNCLNNQSNKCKRMPLYPNINATADELHKTTSAFLVVSQDCNLRCKYCFIKKKPENITLKTAIDAVDYVAENAKLYGDRPSINFFGGEPLLRWIDIIVPVTLYVRGKYGSNFGLSMTSNGILLDRKKLDFMKQYDIGLLFSMDGDKKTQDINRPCKNGSSSFDILERKIPLILEYYPRVTFRATTDYDTVSHFFENHKFAIDKGFTSIFNIINIFAEWNSEQREELKRQVDKLGNYFYDLIDQGNNVHFGPFDEMFGRLKEIKIAEEENIYREFASDVLGYGRCGIGASRFASIGTDGTLYSCQEMVGNKEEGGMFVIGDIYNGEDNEARLNIIRQFHPHKVVSSAGKKACEQCRFNRICNGACLINNYFANEDLNIMPDLLCYFYQILLDKAEDIVNKAKKENNKKVLEFIGHV